MAEIIQQVSNEGGAAAPYLEFPSQPADGNLVTLHRVEHSYTNPQFLGPWTVVDGSGSHDWESRGLFVGKKVQFVQGRTAPLFHGTVTEYAPE